MNFDLSEEQQLLGDSLKRYLTNEYSIDARAKIVASPTGWSETVWAAFAEMGLLGVPFAEEVREPKSRRRITAASADKPNESIVFIIHSYAPNNGRVQLEKTKNAD